MSLIAQVALWSAAVVDFFLRRHHRRRVESDPAAITTIRAFRLAALSAVWCVATLVALDNLGIDITALVTGLGIGGVAIALATQNILGDIFASLSIVLDKPFVVGDFIRSGDQMGVVEQIGLKTTRVRSLSGEQLVFSNNDLLQSPHPELQADGGAAGRVPPRRDVPDAEVGVGEDAHDCNEHSGCSCV